MPFQKGHKIWQGKKRPEVKKWLSPYEKGHKPWNKNKKGIHLSPKSEFKKGEVRLAGNIYGFKKGLMPWNKGKKGVMPIPWNKGKEGISGEKHYNWQGGISRLPYSVDWTKTLKRSIRERDKYTCQICGKEPSVSVHHIDYDKKNCNPTNLITLCRECHAKTNFNKNYWKLWLSTKIKTR